MGELRREALSDLVDGELDARQVEAAIDALLEDAELASEWHRAHQLRGLLRDEVDAPFDVRAAVRNAVAGHPPSVTVLRPRVRPVAPWPRYVWGGALAATVALLVVAGLRPWQSGSDLPAVAQRAPIPSPPPVAVAQQATPLSSPQPAGVAVSAMAVEATGQASSAASVASTAPSALDRFGEIYRSNELFAGQGNEALFQNVSVDGHR